MPLGPDLIRGVVAFAFYCLPVSFLESFGKYNKIQLILSSGHLAINFNLKKFFFYKTSHFPGNGKFQSLKLSVIYEIFF